jgi:chromosomal replication initiator protein
MAPLAREAWIDPLIARSPLREAGDPHDRLTLGCPTTFHRDRVRERFLSEIERCAAAEAGVPVAVDLVVAPAPRGDRPDPAQDAPESPPQRENLPARRAPAPRPDERAAAPDPQREFPYRFDNFVVGSCNALAREASIAVARSTQRALNPLVLAAAPGLGKTHLARAIVNEARQHGEQRAIYASAEAFTSDFTRSLQMRRIDDFKRRFRHGCRLLVLEDVQFLDARKKATQLELFHTICHLLDVGARVVLTADRLPRDIEGLDPRLGSKLSSGLVAELDSPDGVVRREILRQKAADGGVRLPDACRELIVESVRGSVRDLEGVLIQLVAMASLLKRPIDPELTMVALRKLAPIPGVRHPLAIRDVVETVATYFKKRPDEIAARSRRRDVLWPRQLAMYLGHRYTGASLSVIGAALGRNHSAAANAVRKVERRILESAPLRYQVEALCARLDGMTGERQR